MATTTLALKPFKSPSYPPRTHTAEGPKWAAVLKAAQDRIATARKKLDVIPAGPSRAPFEKLYAQMLGARDQIADGARRMPEEVHHMYHDDHFRLEEAVAALDRLFAKWDAGKA